MKNINFPKSFRVFQVLKNVTLLDLERGNLEFNKGHRFIGYYMDEKSIWISNTSIIIRVEHVKEVYKLEFKELCEEVANEL